jgi:hypothetical protein
VCHLPGDEGDAEQSSQEQTEQSAQSQSTSKQTSHHEHGVYMDMHNQENMNAICFLIEIAPISCSLVVYYIHDDMDAVL